MDFINKLINRPKSLPAITSSSHSHGMEEQSIESLLAEIHQNLNQNQSPGAAGSGCNNLTSTTPNSTGKQTPNKKTLQRQLIDGQIVKQKLNENFRNAFCLDDDTDSFNVSQSILNSPKDLPDIVNVTPLPLKINDTACDSPMSVLTKQLGGFGLDSTGPSSSCLALPTSSTENHSSCVSSDDEIFTECQSYSVDSNATSMNEAEVTMQLDATSSQNWDNLVTSVIMSNHDNLDQTLDQQLSEHLDNSLLSACLAPDSTTILSANTSQNETVCMLPRTSTGLESYENIASSSTLDGHFENTTDTDEILNEVNEALKTNFESIEEEDDSPVSKSFPVHKTPNRKIFPTSPVVMKSPALLPILNRNYVVDPPQIEISSPKSEDDDQNITSFPKTPEKKLDASKFPKEKTPEIQSDKALNSTFAASLEALSSTVSMGSMDQTFGGSQELKEKFSDSESDTRKDLPLNSTFADSSEALQANQDTHLEKRKSITLNSTFAGSSETLTGNQGPNETNSDKRKSLTLNNTFAGSSETLVGNQDAKDTNFDRRKTITLNSTFAGSSEALTGNQEEDSEKRKSLNLNSTFAGSAEGLNATVNLGGSQELNNETFNPVLETASNIDISTTPPNEAMFDADNEMDIDFNQPMDEDVEMKEADSSPFKQFENKIEFLSDKEKNAANKEEKEEFVHDLVNTGTVGETLASGFSLYPTDDDFKSNGLIFDSADFDFLLSKGNNNEVDVRRTSLLLRFDPLLGQQTTQAIINPSVNTLTSSIPPVVNRLSACQEEDSNTDKEDNDLNDNNNIVIKQEIFSPKSPPIQITTKSIKKNDNMSVGVIEDLQMENNDIKSIDNLNSQLDEKINIKMDDEPEMKIKNEVVRNEEVERKLKDSEQREESLLKRITEKDKTISKMNGVIEAYEKAIAELIAEKEQIIQNYEKEMNEIKSDRDSNYQHLTSLETTFSDLHIKYEKSKELTAHLKNSEEQLTSEKKQHVENLKLQEQRYDKMKNHAMQQLEIANKKLEDLTKYHSVEATKLKALLKKEEISRGSLTEQLQQKTRENEELVKICDELINGQGS